MKIKRKLFVSSPQTVYVMIRKIVVPQERTYILDLPEEFVGKEVEVLAFALQEESTARPKKSTDDLEKELSGLTVHDPNFTFDRDEANQYE